MGNFGDHDWVAKVFVDDNFDGFRIGNEVSFLEISCSPRPLRTKISMIKFLNLSL